MGQILRRSSVSRLGSGSGSRVVAIIALLLCPLALGQSAPGQSAPVAATEQPETVVDVLHQLSDKADVIFAGQVLAIRRPGNGVVEVEFRVDEAIRGCTSGTTYTLREWAGLWMADNQRYRVGQRLLMLLHAPGAGGLSSPVSGLDGAIPIRQGGAEAQAGAGAQADSLPSSVAPQRPYVDLRWLGVRLPHAVTYRSESPAGNPVDQPASPLAQVHAQQTRLVAASEPATSAAPIVATTLSNAGVTKGSVAAQQASVDAVIGMLTTWQKAQHAAP